MAANYTLAVEINQSGIAITPFLLKDNALSAPKSAFYSYPENMTMMTVFDDIPLFVTFFKQCLGQDILLANKQIVIILKDSLYIEKEFSHKKANLKNIKMIANIEAGAVINDAESDYQIEVFSYGNGTNIKGECKSALYAFSKYNIRELKKEFELAGFNLTKIVPLMNGYCYATREFLNNSKYASTLDNKCYTTLNFNDSHVRVGVFYKGTMLYANVFDSPFGAMVNMVADFIDIDKKKAEEYLLNIGMFANMLDKRAANSISKLERQLITEFNTKIEDIFRSIHFIAAAERLEISKVVISGKYSGINCLDRYIQDIYAVETNAIEVLAPNVRSRININQEASGEWIDGLTLYGVIKTSVNFCNEFMSKQLEKKKMIGIVAASLAVVILIMLIQPIIYMVNGIQTKSAQAALEQPQIQQIRALLDTQEANREQINTLQSDIDVLPYNKTYARLYCELLLDIFEKSPTATIKTYTYDNTSGKFTVSFELANGAHTDYIAIRNAINNTGVLECSQAYNYSINSETGVSTYNISVMVVDSEFTTYN